MVLVDSIGDDPENIKITRPYRAEHPVLSALKNIFLIIFFSCFVFVAVNFPAYFRISKFRLHPQSIALATPQISKGSQPVQTLDNNTLLIPKIGVKAPVQWGVSSENILDSLQNGLVHIQNTGLPGEKKNIFITGHSSNYWWKEGSYNTVFSLLGELSPGDEIFIVYKGKIEKFSVSETKEVGKKEVDGFVEADQEQLTLMTCVPVGTNLRRLLVIAKPAGA